MPPSSEQSKMHIDVDQLVGRFDRNIAQEIFVTTADKARLCLIDAFQRLERQDAWIAPAGILATVFLFIHDRGDNLANPFLTEKAAITVGGSDRR